MSIKALKLSRAYLLFTALLLLSVALAKPSPQQLKDFQATYQSKLNGWVEDKPEQAKECLTELAAYSWSCKHDPYQSMIQYSAHAIGDLGSQKQCEQVSTNSSYVMMSINASTTPVFFR